MGRGTGVLSLAGNAFKSQILPQLAPNPAGETQKRSGSQKHGGEWQKGKVAAALVRSRNEAEEKQAHFRATTQMVPLEHA